MISVKYLFVLAVALVLLTSASASKRSKRVRHHLKTKAGAHSRFRAAAAAAAKCAVQSKTKAEIDHEDAMSVTIIPVNGDPVALKDMRAKAQEFTHKRESQGKIVPNKIEGGTIVGLFKTNYWGSDWFLPVWRQVEADFADTNRNPLALGIMTYDCDNPALAEDCAKVPGPYPRVAISLDEGHTWNTYDGPHNVRDLGRFLYQADGAETPVYSNPTQDWTHCGRCVPNPDPLPLVDSPCENAIKTCWNRMRFGKIKCLCRINALCGSICGGTNGCRQIDGAKKDEFGGRKWYFMG